MVRLAPISATRLIRLLQRLGFREVRRKGSHRYFLHSETKKTAVVPDHGAEDVSIGVLRTILRDLEMDLQEYERLRGE